MCLIVKNSKTLAKFDQFECDWTDPHREEKYTQYLENILKGDNRILIAEDDIKVYKLLDVHDDGRLTTPFRSVPVADDNTLVANRFSFSSSSTDNEPPYYVLTVESGVHSYTSIDAFRIRVRGIIKTHSSIFEAVIPKGTPYILGEDDEIVSLKLVIGNLYTPRS